MRVASDLDPVARRATRGNDVEMPRYALLLGIIGAFATARPSVLYPLLDLCFVFIALLAAHHVYGTYEKTVYANHRAAVDHDSSQHETHFARAIASCLLPFSDSTSTRRSAAKLAKMGTVEGVGYMGRLWKGTADELEGECILTRCFFYSLRS